MSQKYAVILEQAVNNWVVFDFNSNAECRVDAIGYEYEPDRASARD
jgi:hypothetical protein